MRVEGAFSFSILKVFIKQYDRHFQNLPSFGGCCLFLCILCVSLSVAGGQYFSGHQRSDLSQGFYCPFYFYKLKAQLR